MQSTWAGDYPGEYQKYWKSEGETPYLIHWAGVSPDAARPIDALYLDLLTREERHEWNEWVIASVQRRRAAALSLRGRLRACRNTLRTLKGEARNSTD